MKGSINQQSPEKVHLYHYAIKALPPSMNHNMTSSLTQNNYYSLYVVVLRDCRFSFVTYFFIVSNFSKELVKGRK